MSDEHCVGCSSDHCEGFDDFPFDAADRLTAIIESRMSHDLAFLRDDGVTVERLNPEQVAYALIHLYRTGDVVSGLAALGESGTSERCQCGHTRVEHDNRTCTHRCLPPWRRIEQGRGSGMASSMDPGPDSSSGESGTSETPTE